MENERIFDCISDLEVTLDVSLGEISLSLADIASLKAGSVFSFAFDPKKALPIRLDGEVVTYARIVNDGETFALQILGGEV